MAALQTLPSKIQKVLDANDIIKSHASK